MYIYKYRFKYFEIIFLIKEKQTSLPNFFGPCRKERCNYRPLLVLSPYISETAADKTVPSIGVLIRLVKDVLKFLRIVAPIQKNAIILKC